MTTTATSSAAQLLETYSKPVRNNPFLYRINGIGFAFSGTALRHPDLGTDLFVRMHWFTFVLIPILPLGIYLLSHPVDNKGRPVGGSYFIHRAVRIEGVNKIWGPGKFFGMLVSGWLICAGVVLAVAAAVAAFTAFGGRL